MPIFIFAENCTDGTNEWLAKNADELRIDYHIEKDCFASANIYDVKGALVRMLFSEFKVKGSHMVSWDGKDYKGNNASSGIYYFRVKVGTYVESKKMLLIR